MISGITLCFSHRLKIPKPAEINFRPGVNVLIGPNGTGKSTLLRALHECRECRIEKTEETKTLYYDAETMNPHRPHGPPLDLRTMILRTRGIFSSHGEIMKTSLASMPIRKGEVLLVDEPESGQDMEGILRLRAGFDLLCNPGGQVITASHHPLIMQNANIIELIPGYTATVLAEFRRCLCEEKGNIR